MAAHLALGDGAVLADLACGAGGPGLWIASHARASVIGIDPSATGLAEARQRAVNVGLAEHANYHHGTFAATGIDDATADGVLGAARSTDAPTGVREHRAARTEIDGVHRAPAVGGEGRRAPRRQKLDAA